MTLYIGLVRKDVDSAYGVTSPNLPGCFSAADEIDDLVASASEAVALWAEDTALPRPSSIEAIRAEPDIASALANGAFLVAVNVPEAVEAAA